MPVHFASVFVSSTGLFMPGEPVGNDELDRYIAPLERRLGAHQAPHPGRERHPVAPLCHRLKTARPCIPLRAMAASGESTSCLVDAPRSALRRSDRPVHRHVGRRRRRARLREHGAGRAARARRCIRAATKVSARLASQRCSTRRARSSSAMRGHALVVDQRVAIAPVQALALRAARLRHRLRLALPALDAVRRRRRVAARARSRARAGRVAAACAGFTSARSAATYPVCMQIGQPARRQRRVVSRLRIGRPRRKRTAPSCCGRTSACCRTCSTLGIHEYVRARAGRAGSIPTQVDHFLCHYSSQKFAPRRRRPDGARPAWRFRASAGTATSTDARQYRRGVDLHHARRTSCASASCKPGQRILCFVPESGRFTVAFMLFEVVKRRCASERHARRRLDRAGRSRRIAPPHDPPPRRQLRTLLTELASIWHDYRSRAWRTPLIRKITTGQLRARRLRWLDGMLDSAGARRQPVDARRVPRTSMHAVRRAGAADPQARRRRAVRLQDPVRRLSPAPAATHAEHRRTARAIPAAKRSMPTCTRWRAQPNPLGLLGAIYIIEGTGQRIIPALLPLLRKQLDLPGRRRSASSHITARTTSSHLARWLTAVEMAIGARPRRRSGRRIVDCRARAPAELYLLQMEHVTDERR